MKKNLDLNKIQQEIIKNKKSINNCDIDVYTFMSELTAKYIKPIFPGVSELEGKNPYADLLFAMLEINGIELY